MATEESRPVLYCPVLEKIDRILLEKGFKPPQTEPGPDGLLPGWVMGSYSCRTDTNGVRREGPYKRPIPMFCFLCGSMCDHWPENCTSNIRPESRYLFKTDQKTPPPPPPEKTPTTTTSPPI